MSFRKICVAALLAALVPGLRAEPHPIWSRLKTQRNYYVLEDASPYRHRFLAWFTDGGYAASEIGADTVAEIQAMGEEDMGLSSGLFAVPPPSVPPIPEEMRPLAEAYGARLRELYPELHSLQIQYEGRKRLFQLVETRPSVPVPDVQQRRSRRAEVQLALAEGAEELELHGTFNILGGFSNLVRWGEGQELPDFVDFLPPPAIEGSPLVLAHAQEVGGLHAEAWKQLSAQVVVAADALADGGYQNPIEELLEAQGDEALPPDFDSFVDLSITTWAMQAPSEPGIRDSLSFRFLLSEVAAGPVVRARTSMGLEYRVSLDLASMVMDLAVSTPDGEVGKLSVPVDGALVRTDEAAAIVGGVLFLPDDPYPEIQLPGHGAYRSFSVYPDSMLAERPLFEDRSATVNRP